MADYWNVGIVVMIVTLLGGFAVFMVTMPSGFFYGSSYSSYREIDYPNYWTQGDIENYIYRLNDNVSLLSNTWYDFNLASPSIDAKLILYWNFEGFTLFRQRYAGIIPVPSILTWENKSITTISESDVINRFDLNTNASKFQPVYDEGISTVVWFLDTNQTRNNVTLALSEQLINVEIAFGMSNITLTYNIWTLLGRLLFFQAPDIFGSGVGGLILNALIAIPLWTAIIYLIVRLILLFIPFWGG